MSNHCLPHTVDVQAVSMTAESKDSDTSTLKSLVVTTIALSSAFKFGGSLVPQVFHYFSLFHGMQQLLFLIYHHPFNPSPSDK